MLLSPSLATGQESAPATSLQGADEGLPPSNAPPLNSFATLPFIEGARISPAGTAIAGQYAVGGQQLIGILPLFDSSKNMFVGVPDDTQALWVRWVGNENIVVKLQGLLPVGTDRWYISRLIGINVRTGKITKLLWDLNGQNGADLMWTASDGKPEVLVSAQASIYPV